MASAKKLTRHSMFLYTGDYARLQELYPGRRAAMAIRLLVREHLRQRTDEETNDLSDSIERALQDE